MAATAQRQEAEQREQEKRKLGKVDFVKGGVQAPALAVPGPDGRPIQLASTSKGRQMLLICTAC
jgi:hypothetical protein